MCFPVLKPVFKQKNVIKKMSKIYHRIAQCCLVKLESRTEPAELEFLHGNRQYVNWSKSLWRIAKYAKLYVKSHNFSDCFKRDNKFLIKNICMNFALKN